MDDISGRSGSVSSDSRENGNEMKISTISETPEGFGVKTDSSLDRDKNYFKAIGLDVSKHWPKRYRFTREKPTGRYNPMTISQRNFYEANGYIVFDDCVNTRLLDSLRTNFRTSGVVEDSLIDRLLLRNDNLLKYAKCFCDEQLMLMTHRILETFQPDDLRDVIDNGLQQRRVLFRDWVYLPFRPIDKVCCAVTAIEPLEHVLLVVPGTHRVGQCTITSTVDGNQQGVQEAAQKGANSRQLFESSPERLSTLIEKSAKGFKYIDLKPGQTLFYHPGLINGFNNDLINFRKQQLVSIAYYAASDCEYIDLREDLSLGGGAVSDLPPIPIGLGHFGKDKSPISYTSWLDKPKLIRERDANLLKRFCYSYKKNLTQPLQHYYYVSTLFINISIASNDDR